MYILTAILALISGLLSVTFLAIGIKVLKTPDHIYEKNRRRTIIKLKEHKLLIKFLNREK